MRFTDEELASWTLEKLKRKADQAWDMAGLARQDNDRTDELKHTENARRCDQEIGRRLRGEV